MNSQVFHGFAAVVVAKELGSTSQDAMNGQTLKQNLVIVNAEGLHFRPATAFAERARQFQSSVTVSKGSKSVNGKSPLDMLLLVALQGSELTLEVTGPDAAEALQALVKLLVGMEVAAESGPPLPLTG